MLKKFKTIGEHKGVLTKGKLTLPLQNGSDMVQRKIEIHWYAFLYYVCTFTTVVSGKDASLMKSQRQIILK